ncbi:MAG: hypothetical protein ACOYMA_01700 [Bacteroidia bacterium]
MKTDIQKFIIKSFVFIIGLFILDLGIGSLLEYFFNKQSSGLLFETNNVIKYTKAEVLVFGSSRANHHYVPAVFESKTSMSFYNCGRDGSGLLYSAAIIKAVCNRYTPKKIIIDILPYEFSFNEYDRLGALLPFHKNKIIYPYILKKSQFENIKLFSSIYPYNSLLTNIIVGNLDFNKKRYVNSKGYYPLYRKLNYLKPLVNNDRQEIDSTKIFEFKEILLYLSNKGIKTYVIISPQFIVQKNQSSCIIAKKICAKYPNVFFVDMVNDSVYLANSLLFDDPVHLNNMGAIKFSNEITKIIINH